MSLFSDVESKLSLAVGDAEAAEASPAAADPAATPEDAPSPADRRPRKLESSKDFLQSHLMRASVLSPAIVSAVDGGEAALNGELGSSSGDGGGTEQEAHHAGGMGCTALAMLVRGSDVVVANTGARAGLCVCMRAQRGASASTTRAGEPTRRVALAGDSRCVLSRKGQAVALTLDHKPILFEEARRIIKASERAAGRARAVLPALLCPPSAASPHPLTCTLAHPATPRLAALCATTASTARSTCRARWATWTLSATRTCPTPSRWCVRARGRAGGRGAVARRGHPPCLVHPVHSAPPPSPPPQVVATPDIEHVRLQDGDEFALLACDGIWDVLSNQEVRGRRGGGAAGAVGRLPRLHVRLAPAAPRAPPPPLFSCQAVDFVRKRLKSNMSLKQICEEMCDACLAPDLKGLCRGADNMTVVVVLFRKTARLEGGMSRALGSMWRALGGGKKR